MATNQPRFETILNDPKSTINYAENAAWTWLSAELTKKGADAQRLSKIKKFPFE